MSDNPYAPPKAVVADIQNPADAPPLWNPNAAANWSLLFSPAFGAYVHMKNWEALGETGKASIAKIWVIVVAVILLGLPLVPVLMPGVLNLQGFSSPIGLLLLISWYVGIGRAQATYVKERFGNTYPRRGWGKPILIALAVMFAYFLIVAVLAALFLSGLGIAGRR